MSEGRPTVALPPPMPRAEPPTQVDDHLTPASPTDPAAVELISVAGLAQAIREHRREMRQCTVAMTQKLRCQTDALGRMVGVLHAMLGVVVVSIGTILALLFWLIVKE